MTTTVFAPPAPPAPKHHRRWPWVLALGVLGVGAVNAAILVPLSNEAEPAVTTPRATTPRVTSAPVVERSETDLDFVALMVSYSDVLNTITDMEDRATDAIDAGNYTVASALSFQVENRFKALLDVIPYGAGTSTMGLMTVGAFNTCRVAWHNAGTSLESLDSVALSNASEDVGDCGDEMNAVADYAGTLG